MTQEKNEETQQKFVITDEQGNQTTVTPVSVNVVDAEGNEGEIIPSKRYVKGQENLKASTEGKLARTGQQKDPLTGKFLAKPKTPQYLQNAGKKAANRIRNLLDKKSPQTGLRVYEQCVKDLVEIIKTQSKESRPDLDEETRAKFAGPAVKAFEILSNRAYGKPVQEEAPPPAGIKFVVIENPLPNSEVIDYEETIRQPTRPSFAVPEAKVISVTTNEPYSEMPKVEEKRPETKTETKTNDSGSDFFVAPAYKR